MKSITRRFLPFLVGGVSAVVILIGMEWGVYQPNEQRFQKMEVKNHELFVEWHREQQRQEEHKQQKAQWEIEKKQWHSTLAEFDFSCDSICLMNQLTQIASHSHIRIHSFEWRPEIEEKNRVIAPFDIEMTGTYANVYHFFQQWVQRNMLSEFRIVSWRKVQPENGDLVVKIEANLLVQKENASRVKKGVSQ